MNGPLLPPDPSQWPDNPYQLLGVGHDVLPRDLRKAYTALIRVYKPEQHPEEFRRIREAYETVLRHVQVYRSEETCSAESAPAGESPSEALTPSKPDLEIRRVPGAPALDEELEDLWRRACSGEEQGAYRGLLELHERNPQHAAIYLRLYWLLSVEPVVDPARSPCDWLVQGLSATGLSGPLRELYRREVAGNPAEALTPRCGRLLDVPAAAVMLADLLVWRWRAAGQLQQADIIANDIVSLRARLARED
ncbi:MAG TPA: J domain-containing protein, partial [Gemmataceae bacterium]|nr:J domain-containing protein [Gemmataceae bacterium]